MPLQPKHVHLDRQVFIIVYSLGEMGQATGNGNRAGGLIVYVRGNCLIPVVDTSVWAIKIYI